MPETEQAACRAPAVVRGAERSAEVKLNETLTLARPAPPRRVVAVFRRAEFFRRRFPIELTGGEGDVTDAVARDRIPTSSASSAEAKPAQACKREDLVSSFLFCPLHPPWRRDRLFWQPEESISAADARCGR